MAGGGPGWWCQGWPSRCILFLHTQVSQNPVYDVLSIGEPELINICRDPGFDKDQSAFYYARVIEIPTPRWTAYEAKRFQVEMPGEVPMTIQERAYTSPIWYTP